MRPIFKIFHEKNSTEFQEVHQLRFNYDSTIQLDLYIKPMSQPHAYELYYVPTNQMLKLISMIHVISGRLQKTFDRLPAIAQKQFINECLVEELYNTNELEGIRSTREEIAKSTKDAITNQKSKKRFASMIKSYLMLLNKGIEYPKTPQDVRAIYDDITDGEIENSELPDGDIFRRETTYILKKSGTGKVVHQGITPESEVTHAINKLLEFMNHNEEIPVMIKVAIGHYYFGYIHPFYDGNGRTSRFISSMYLSEILGDVSALSLSRACNKYKNKYLESFEITNSIRSRGEMNHFIESFLEMMKDALSEMNVELKEKSELLYMAIHKLENEAVLQASDQICTDVLFVLAQDHFFNFNNGLTIKELAEVVDKSEATIRKTMRELSSFELVEKRGEKPAYYSIKNEYFES